MRILWVATRFPVYSETFLQREAKALAELGHDVTIVSLHGGETEFEGLPVRRFSKFSLVRLAWLLPMLLLTRWSRVRALARAMVGKAPPTFLSLGENLLGFGAAIVMESEIRRVAPEVIHCVWSSAPAAFGWMGSSLTGIPFSTGAHAYDVFENGGDWMLAQKCENALLVHTTTESARERLAEIVPDDRIALIRRGLNRLPQMKPLRQDLASLRIVCVARLVEKKGFPNQIDIYEQLRAAGVAFEARIIGDGPLRSWIEAALSDRGLSEAVTLTGRLSQEGVRAQFDWADALIHTGIVARSGDRDGLPNVVPEAMASGVLVFGSNVSGVGEAVLNGDTGFLLDPDRPLEWVEAIRRAQLDESTRIAIQANARAWVEGHFIASRNSARLVQRLNDKLS